MRVSFSLLEMPVLGASIIGLAPTERGLRRVPAKVGEPQATAVGTKSGGPVPRGVCAIRCSMRRWFLGVRCPMLLKAGRIETRRLHNDGRKNASRRLM